MKQINREVQLTIASIVLLSVILLVGGTELNQITSFFRVIVGSIFLLFLPGRRLTRVFFNSNEIDLLERIALSFALSIAIVPLFVFYLNLVGVPISVRLVYGVVVALVSGAMAWIFFRGGSLGGIIATES